MAKIRKKEREQDLKDYETQCLLTQANGGEDSVATLPATKRGYEIMGTEK